MPQQERDIRAPQWLASREEESPQETADKEKTLASKEGGDNRPTAPGRGCRLAGEGRARQVAGGHLSSTTPDACGRQSQLQSAAPPSLKISVPGASAGPQRGGRGGAAHSTGTPSSGYAASSSGSFRTASCASRHSCAVAGQFPCSAERRAKGCVSSSGRRAARRDRGDSGRRTASSASARADSSAALRLDSASCCSVHPLRSRRRALRFSLAASSSSRRACRRAAEAADALARASAASARRCGWGGRQAGGEEGVPLSLNEGAERARERP